MPCARRAYAARLRRTSGRYLSPAIHGMGDFTHCKCFSFRKHLRGGVELDEAVLVRKGRGGGACTTFELGEDVAQVPVDRLLAESELARDRLVRPAARDQPKHLQLASRQPVVRRGL